MSLHLTKTSGWRWWWCALSLSSVFNVARKATLIVFG
jgi:hypothetical protein